MSRHSLFTELQLDDYLQSVLGCSQEETKSPPKKSPVQKSQSDQDSIEKPRRAHIPTQEEKVISQPEQRNRQDYLTPIDKVTIHPKSSPETINISTRDNTVQKGELSITQSNKPTPVSSHITDIDRGLKFSPTVGKFISDNEASQGSNPPNAIILEKPCSEEKSKTSSAKLASKSYKKNLSTSFDEEDVDLIDEMLEEDMKKKSQSEGHQSQQPEQENKLTDSQKELFDLSQSFFIQQPKATESKLTSPHKHPSQLPTIPDDSNAMPTLMVARTMKPIQIDQSKIDKAANIFKEDDHGLPPIPSDPNAMPTLMVARTMKPIQIDQSKIDKAASIFKEDEHGDLVPPNEKVNHSKLIKISNPKNIKQSFERTEEPSHRQPTNNFKSNFNPDPITSQAKRIGVKPDTLKNILSKFEDNDADLPEPPVNMADHTSSPAKVSTFEPLADGFGFFAGGLKSLKPIEISSDRLNEASKFMDAEDNPLPNTIFKKPSEISKKVDMPVLTTGSLKKHIPINPEKLAAASKLFEDNGSESRKSPRMDIEETSGQSTFSNSTKLNTFSTSTFEKSKEKPKQSPFKFVSTSPIKSTSPSAHSPINTVASNPGSQPKSKTSDFVSESTSHQPLTETHTVAESKITQCTFSTQSQRGEGLKVSNVSSFNRIMNLFKDEFPKEKKAESSIVPLDKSSPVLKTASNNKPIAISKERLQNAASFLADDEAEDTKIIKPTNNKPPSASIKVAPPTSKPPSVAFQTAGGKGQIQINSDKLKNFKSMFEDDDEDFNAYPDEDPETTFGFNLAPPKPQDNLIKTIPSPQSPVSKPSILLNGQKLNKPQETIAPIAKPQNNDIGFSKGFGGSKIMVNTEKAKKFLSEFEDFDEEDEKEVSQVSHASKNSKGSNNSKEKKSPPKAVEIKHSSSLTHSFSFGDPKQDKSAESTLQSDIFVVNTLIDSMQSPVPVLSGTMKLEPDPYEATLQPDDRSLTPDRPIELIKQNTKMRLINEPLAGKKTVPSKEAPKTNNFNGKFSVRPLEDASKKPGSRFKFTEKDAKPKEELQSDMKDESKSDDKKSLKRNYDSFVETSGLQETNVEYLKYLDANPKINHFKSLLKVSRRTEYRHSYFRISNISKKIIKEANSIKGINYINAIEHTFTCSCIDDSTEFSLPCICKENLFVTWKELWEYMLSLGYKKEYMSESWFKNHFRFIVWKLVAIQRRIAKVGPSKDFNLFNIKNELEYRYYIEHIEGKRSVLQKILQKDEVASAHMVLLVVSIQKEGNKMVVQLSDGWYSIFTEVKLENSIKIEKNHMTNNQLLSVLISSGKLYPGLKIHVANMKVMKAEGQDPNKEMSPDDKTFVELSYNSISRAKWDEKLGVATSRYFSKCLKSMRNLGGAVSMIDVIVLKKYKVLVRNGGMVQIFDEQQEEQIDPKAKLSFRIRVIDAAVYYSLNQEKLENVYCEIEFSQHQNLYQEIKENERIKIYNLKGFSKFDKTNFSFYDHNTQKTYTHYLYLQMQKTSRCQFFSTMKSYKEEHLKLKEFAKKNFPAINLLTQLQLDLANVSEEFNKNVQNKNEADFIGVIQEADNQKSIGFMSDGNIFKLMVHHRQFFPNIKILDKPGNFILVRNAQVTSVEKILNDPGYCFTLRTNENTFFSQSPAIYKDENNVLNLMTKDTNKMAEIKLRLDRLLKRHKEDYSASFDDEELDAILNNQKKDDKPNSDDQKKDDNPNPDNQKKDMSTQDLRDLLE